jgi:hypothetical protein
MVKPSYGSSRCWQVEGEGAANTELAHRADGAAVGFGEVPDDGHAQAAAAGGPASGGVGAPEAVEDAGKVRGGFPVPVSMTEIVSRPAFEPGRMVTRPPAGVCRIASATRLPTI